MDAPNGFETYSYGLDQPAIRWFNVVPSDTEAHHLVLLAHINSQIPEIAPELVFSPCGGKNCQQND